MEETQYLCSQETLISQAGFSLQERCQEFTSPILWKVGTNSRSSTKRKCLNNGIDTQQFESVNPALKIHYLQQIRASSEPMSPDILVQNRRTLVVKSDRI